MGNLRKCSKDYFVNATTDSLHLGSGGSWTWAWHTLGIPYSMGMRLRDQGQMGVLVAADEIVASCEEIWAFHENVGKQIIQKFSKT